MFHRDEAHFMGVHFVGLLHECKKIPQLSQRVWNGSQCKQWHVSWTSSDQMTS